MKKDANLNLRIAKADKELVRGAGYSLQKLFDDALAKTVRKIKKDLKRGEQ